jgi:hypothetical protein
MKKVVRLTENELLSLIKRVLKEDVSVDTSNLKNLKAKDINDCAKNNQLDLMSLPFNKLVQPEVRMACLNVTKGSDKDVYTCGFGLLGFQQYLYQNPSYVNFIKCLHEKMTKSNTDYLERGLRYLKGK